MGVNRLKNVLSVFIDESGVFGEFSTKAPYYMVSMVFHEQRIDITDEIAILDRHIKELGFPPHAVLWALLSAVNQYINCMTMKSVEQAL